MSEFFVLGDKAYIIILKKTCQFLEDYYERCSMFLYNGYQIDGIQIDEGATLG